MQLFLNKSYLPWLAALPLRQLDLVYTFLTCWLLEEHLLIILCSWRNRNLSIFFEKKSVGSHLYVRVSGFGLNIKYTLLVPSAHPDHLGKVRISTCILQRSMLLFSLNSIQFKSTGIIFPYTFCYFWSLIWSLLKHQKDFKCYVSAKKCTFFYIRLSNQVSLLRLFSLLFTPFCSFTNRILRWTSYVWVKY